MTAVGNKKDDIADKSFIDDDTNQQGTPVSFYGRFHNQTHDTFEALNDQNEDNCKLEPEIYWEIVRSFV